MQNNYFYAEYHLLTMLGDLGGLYGIVMGLGWFIAAPLVSRLSKAAMVHSNYRLQSYDFDDSQYYQTKIAGEVSSASSSSGDNNEQHASVGQVPLMPKKSKSGPMKSSRTQVDTKAASPVNFATNKLYSAKQRTRR